MLYPGEVIASANLDPEDDIICSLTSCTAVIKRDTNFTVSVSLRNEVGTSVSPEIKFDCKLSIDFLKLRICCIALY